MNMMLCMIKSINVDVMVYCEFKSDFSRSKGVWSIRMRVVRKSWI